MKKSKVIKLVLVSGLLCQADYALAREVNKIAGNEFAYKSAEPLAFASQTDTTKGNTGHGGGFDSFGHHHAGS